MRNPLSMLSRCLFTLLLLLPVSTNVFANYSIGLATWTGYPDNVQGFKESFSRLQLDEKKLANFSYQWF